MPSVAGGRALRRTVDSIEFGTSIISKYGELRPTVTVTILAIAAAIDCVRDRVFDGLDRRASFAISRASAGGAGQ